MRLGWLWRSGAAQFAALVVEFVRTVSGKEGGASAAELAPGARPIVPVWLPRPNCAPGFGAVRLTLNQDPTAQPPNVDEVGFRVTFLPNGEAQK